MTKHVRDYLLQQLNDGLILLVFCNSVTLGQLRLSAWYYQWGSSLLFFGYLLVILGLLVVGLWRPRPDAREFTWAQADHWLYLANEPQGDFRGLNWTKGIWCGAIIFNLLVFQFGATLGWSTGQQLVVKLTVAVAVGGLVLGIIGLWAVRWWQHHARLRGGQA
ncbi:MAG: hypothetical protein LKH74_11015 [Levilactobacillus sp.]|uniref:hypothetical protein n=1 Tax=Levilactobacillus sp. TaxID=2767919 RepID=UPI00258F2F9F|nr:hypothetical protein [Levilactobacillus sp.]MCI1554440.1 hypothetical protein [Levilactobacillus sp.]MCI1598229.1 hypothetical protein [Levilactobacillus sp.]MCI1605922.1 hypothetical protein [Levilactobacillus sp.]